ncbi:cytochrome b/b6 domain-containing protein [Moritella sp. 24]|uniref:cytochrome b n=1 Tax=Moritella sp. 24 TaxID=2746230 RepID=UPI001BA786E0|nr:cytochrome b/b6 domain-containing protein [Moritella sp. 24]QUM75589.1 cytochrome b/b6 domain-containing protein [Moritella sp. 24]
MSKVIIQFDTTAKYLHWVSALVILWASISGLYIAYFELESNIKSRILSFNVSITTLFIPLFCWRIYYRIKQGIPQAHPAMSALEVKLAHAGHTLLYVLVSLVLVSGVLMMDHDVNVFQLFIIPQLLQQPSNIHFFETLHLYTCRLLVALIVCHLGALIKHEMMGRRILKRMI